MIKKINGEYNGALYGDDGKTLLKLPDHKSYHYIVTDGTGTVAENAFVGLSYSNAIDSLNLPGSITRLKQVFIQKKTPYRQTKEHKNDE